MKIFRIAAKIIFALFFVAAGDNHFINTTFYIRIMPKYHPWHYELVMMSGVDEGGGGIG